MLQPIIHILNAKKIVLASGSPRRQELIKNIGLKAQLCPSTFEENLDPKSFNDIGEFVEETALQKVLEVDNRLKGQSNEADIIIGADTMVTLNEKLYGKPGNVSEAIQMLSELNGRGHVVYTGLVVKSGSTIVRLHEKTNVFFGKLTKDQIEAYAATGDPLDKAGGYGIQGMAGTMIEKIDGDYFNVMGLPLHRLSNILYDIFYTKK